MPSSSRFAVFVVAALAALASLPAEAQDGGPCILDGGTIDQSGKCDGNDAVFCSSATAGQGTLQRLHCPALPINDTLTLNNGFCDILSNIGAWCTFPPTTPCSFDDGNGGTLYFGCGTPTEDEVDFACDVIDGCVDISSTPLLFGCLQTAPRCIGSHLRVDCTSWQQAGTIDCAGESGVCDPNNAAGPVCVDGVGGACDNVLLLCATGLTCSGFTSTTLGHCVDPNAPVDAGTTVVDSGTVVDAGTAHDAGTEHDAGVSHDAGTVVVVDAGTVNDAGHAGEGEGSGDPGIGLGDTPDSGVVDAQALQSGCGCASSSPAGPLLGACGLVVLALVRRRRR